MIGEKEILKKKIIEGKKTVIDSAVYYNRKKQGLSKNLLML